MIEVAKDAIKFRNSEGQMQSAGVLCEVGVVCDDRWNYIQNLSYMFYKAVFPSGYVLVVDLPLENAEENNCLSYAFSNTKVDKIVLKGNVNSILLNATYTFQNAKMKEIDLSGFNFTVNGMSNTFNGCGELESIIGEFDLFYCTSINNAFHYTYKLVNIAFKSGTIFKSISFKDSTNLSDASIQSIIDGLADLTGGTTQTLTFHADVKAKLTEEQIATITSKNWTLA